MRKYKKALESMKKVFYLLGYLFLGVCVCVKIYLSAACHSKKSGNILSSFGWIGAFLFFENEGVYNTFPLVLYVVVKNRKP